MTLRLLDLLRTAAIVLPSLVLLPASLFSQDTGWAISSFDAQYTVNADRTIDVTERIIVDFGPLQRHGIYREIPVRYAKVLKAGLPLRAGTVKVGLDDVSVTDVLSPCPRARVL